jgi:putative ABC transport system ATP-binding protein
MEVCLVCATAQPEVWDKTVLNGCVAGPAAPALEYVDVHRAFPEAGRAHEALCGVTLAIFPGEFVAVVGKSGSGKTTLLNLACGVDVPTAGVVRVSGRSLSDLSDRQRSLLRRTHFGIVFQFFNLMSTLSVEENVMLPAQLAGLSVRASRERAHALLRDLGLAGRERDRIDRLSGGEQQRVAMARALINNPPVILADEPTGNLDSECGSVVLKCLKRLSEEQGRTVLMVTHSSEALGFADRIVHLRDGRIVSDQG